MGQGQFTTADLSSAPQQIGQYSAADLNSTPQPQPGFLDKNIPLDSYKDATLSGVQSIGRGVRTGIQSLASTFGPKQPDENAFTSLPFVRMAKSLIQTGKQAAQVPAAVSDINKSPDPLGTYGKVAQDTAGGGAGQALLALGTEGISKAAPVVGDALADSTQPARQALAEGTIAKLIKPSRNDVAFGRNPAGAIVNEGITANSLEDLGDKVYAKANDVGSQIDKTLQGPSAQGKIIDVSKSLKPIDAGMADAVRTGNKGLYDQLNQFKQQLTQNWAEDPKSGSIVPTGPKQLQMTPYEATKLKRDVGNMTRWTGTDPFEDDVNAVKNNVFSSLKNQVNQAVPDVADLNNRYSNLASAAKAVERQVPISARSSLWSLGNLGAATAGLHYGTPAAIAAIAAKNAAGSAFVGTRFAKMLAGPH